MAAEIQSWVMRATSKLNNKNKTENTDTKELLTVDMSEKQKSQSCKNNLLSPESNSPKAQSSEEISGSNEGQPKSFDDVTDDVIHEKEHQQKYYHIFTQNELNSLFQSVRNLGVTEWYQLKGSWVYILTKSSDS